MDLAVIRFKNTKQCLLQQEREFSKIRNKNITQSLSVVYSKFSFSISSKNIPLCLFLKSAVNCVATHSIAAFTSSFTAVIDCSCKLVKLG